ncbi:hypothetical protein DTQ70_03760 [Runella sp. SP2]|nr:hypothetical protein DTQ70_03760 [Runella sp. SP2]
MWLSLLTAIVTQAQVSRETTEQKIDSLLPVNTARLITPIRLQTAFRKVLDYVQPNIANGGLSPLKLSSGGATSGQILKWNGSAWVPSADAVGSAPTWGAITGTLSTQSDLQTALNGKANTSHTHLVGDLTQSGATTGQVIKWNGTAWTPSADAVGSSPTWGSLTGTLSTQSDLNSALAGKEPLISVGGLALNKISLSGATEGNVLKISGGVLTYATDATGGGASGNVISTVTNIAALKTRVGAYASEGVRTMGYYTANDGGGWLYIWNATSTATANDGSVIQVTGQATGRWEIAYYGYTYARWFGVKADGTTDDKVTIKKAIDFAVSKGGDLYLGQGVIITTDELFLGTVSPASLPSAEKIRIIGEGPTFDWNTSSPQFTTGTMIMLRGSGKNAVLNITAGLGRYLKLENFTVSCETNGGAEYGVLWSTTATSAHSLERIHSYKANKAFGILAGGYANGEFTHFEDCVGSGITNFFYMAPNTGQAFNHLFVNCHGGVTGDGGVIFQIGGGGLGFGLTLVNFNSSNAILSNFMTGLGTTLLKSEGVSGIISMRGGRIEQVSTLLNLTQGSNLVNGKFVFEDVHFDGMQCNSSRKFIKTTSNNSSQSLQFKNCIFSPLVAQESNSEVNIELGQYSESEYRFDRCNFSRFPKYDISHTQTTKGKVIFDNCQRTNFNSNGSIIFSKAYCYNEPTPSLSVHKPQNFLLQSGFSASTGGDIVATSPWTHTTQSSFYELYNKDNALGSPQSSDTRYRQFALKANASVSQVVSALSFGSGDNVYRYRIYLSFYQAANSPFRVRLKNSSTGKVYDSVTLLGPGTDNELMQVDLLAHDSNVGGNLVVELTNLNTDWPARINMYGQYVYTNTAASFIETTTSTLNQPLIVR